MRPRCGSVLFSHIFAAVSPAGGRIKCTWCAFGCDHNEAPTGATNHEWNRHAMRGFALCEGSSLTASGARPMSAATPLLVADVLDIFAWWQNRRGNHFEFIAVLMSGYEGGLSEDRIRQLYSKQGKKNTLSAIREYLVKNHGGLTGDPYKTFAKLPFHEVAQWRECGAPPNPIGVNAGPCIHAIRPKGTKKRAVSPREYSRPVVTVYCNYRIYLQ